MNFYGDLIYLNRDFSDREEMFNEIGTVLNHRMQETFELEKLYGEVKNKYDVLYKDLNIEKNKTATILIAVILVASLLFNILNFITLMKQ